MELAEQNGTRMLNMKTADYRNEKVQVYAAEAGIKGNIIQVYG